MNMNYIKYHFLPIAPVAPALQLEEMYMRTWNERNAYTDRYVKRQERLYKCHNIDREITKYMRGHWKNNSAYSCRTSNCNFCSSPRYVKWNSLRERLTRQERRSYESFVDQLADYYTEQSGSRR